MKTCRVCTVEKPDDQFPNWKRGNNTCFACHNERRTAQRRARGVKQRAHVTEYMRKYRAANKDKLLEARNKERISNPLAALWRQMKRKKHAVTISREAFMRLHVPDTCPVLGIPISYTLTRDNIPSVDRIDPNRPYEEGNIAIISYRANMIKSIGSAEEHRRISEWMKLNGNPDGRAIGGSALNVGTGRLTFGRQREAV